MQCLTESRLYLNMSCTLDNFPMFVNTQERHKRQRLTLLPTSMEESFVVVGLVQKSYLVKDMLLYIYLSSIFMLLSGILVLKKSKHPKVNNKLSINPPWLHTNSVLFDKHHGRQFCIFLRNNHKTQTFVVNLYEYSIKQLLLNILKIIWQYSWQQRLKLYEGIKKQVPHFIKINNFRMSSKKVVIKYSLIKLSSIRKVIKQLFCMKVQTRNQNTNHSKDGLSFC